MDPFLAWILTHVYQRPHPDAPRTIAVLHDDLPSVSQWFLAVAGDGGIIATLSKLSAFVDVQQLLWSQPDNPQPLPPLSIINSSSTTGASMLGGVLVLQSQDLPPVDTFRAQLKAALAEIPPNLRAFLANKGVLVLVGAQARALKRLFLPQTAAVYQALTSVNGNPRTGLLSMAFSRNKDTAAFVQRQLADCPFILVQHARIRDVLDFQNAYALSKLVNILRCTCGVVIDLADEDAEAAESRTTDLGLYWVTPNSFIVQQAVTVAASQPRCVSAQDQAVARGAAWLKRPLHHFEVQDAVAHSRELQRRAAIGLRLTNDLFAQACRA